MEVRVASSLDHFVSSLRDRCAQQVRELILFGSQARGEAHAGSDVDVLVVVEKRRADVLDDIYDAVLDAAVAFGVVLSVKVCDISHVHRMEAANDAFWRAIRSEGIDLWISSSEAA